MGLGICISKKFYDISIVSNKSVIELTGMKVSIQRSFTEVLEGSRLWYMALCISI
jgi:hypothetical protein